MTNSTLIDDPDFAPGGSPKAKGINPLVQAELTDGERLIWVGRPRWTPTSGWLPTSVGLLCGVIGGLMGLLGSVLVLGGLLDRSNVMNGPLIPGFSLAGLSLFILWVKFRDLIGRFVGRAGTRMLGDPLRARLNRRARDTHTP